MRNSKSGRGKETNDYMLKEALSLWARCFFYITKLRKRRGKPGKETKTMDLQTPITTQEQLDEIIKGRLDREKEKHAKELESFKNLETEKAGLVDELATFKKQKEEEDAKHAAELAALNEKVRGFEMKENRTKVALENGLTVEAAQFITGNTDEEIKSQVEALKKITAVTSPGAMFDDPEPVSGEDKAEKAKKVEAAQFLKSLNLNQ